MLKIIKTISKLKIVGNIQTNLGALILNVSTLVVTCSRDVAQLRVWSWWEISEFLPRKIPFRKNLEDGENVVPTRL